MKKLTLIIALFAASVALVSAQEYGVQWTRQVYHVTTAKTTHVTTSTSVLHTLLINVTGSPTSETITIQTAESTPKIIYKSAALSSPITLPVVIPLSIGIVCNSGIDIVTGGTINTGIADVWLSYR